MNTDRVEALIKRMDELVTIRLRWAGPSEHFTNFGERKTETTPDWVKFVDGTIESVASAIQRELDPPVLVLPEPGSLR